ncbi:MAG: hypothetical protein AAGA42_11995, partial [Actinomycetota bacterium]
MLPIDQVDVAVEICWSVVGLLDMPAPAMCSLSRSDAPGGRHPMNHHGYRLPATGYRLPATGYRLPATGYRLPAT